VIDEDAPEVEVVDGLPVVAEEATVAERPPGLVPARQAAALAATGFVAGAATAAVVRGARSRRASRKSKKRKQLAGIGEIVSSNSFLIDVHLLRRD
jgi:hypothetical protein